jgi:hypothetical protein
MHCGTANKQTPAIEFILNADYNYNNKAFSMKKAHNLMSKIGTS